MVTVDSQVQYYGKLTVTPEKNENEFYYQLKPEMLPHFVNSAEWNLGELWTETCRVMEWENVLLWQTAFA